MNRDVRAATCLIAVAMLVSGCASFDVWLGIAPPPIATEPDRQVRPTDDLVVSRTWYGSQAVTVCVYESGSTRALRDYHNDVLCPWRYFA